MKRSRGLWVSVIAIGLIMALSIAAFAANRLRPVLGLDLQGGVSVILSAPEGTAADTMNTALENIRNRVDAFGVGRARHRAVGHHDRDPDPGSVRQHGRGARRPTCTASPTRRAPPTGAPPTRSRRPRR